MVGLLLLSLFFFFKKAPTEGTNYDTLPERPVEKQPNEPSVTNFATGKVTAQNVYLPPNASINSQSNDSEATLRQIVEEKNVAINFWGVVIDQNGKPLEGVNVYGNVRTWYMTQTLNFDSRFPKVSAVSDSGGKFEMNSLQGDVLTISALEKEGYEPEPGSLRGFGYHTSEKFSADPNNPIVFRMWKKDIKEPLITGEKFFKVIPDGRTYTIDFVKGNINESSNPNGDLSVWIKRTDPQIGRKYDWSFSVQAHDGGLSKEADEYNSMYLAPEDNYTSVFEGNFLASEEHWGNAISGKRFYIKTRNGQVYGRIEIDVYASYGNTGEGRFWIKYAVNPTGSRILR